MASIYQIIKNTSTKRLFIVEAIDDLPESAPESSLYFVRDGRRLYVYGSQGPIPIVTENDPPTWVNVPDDDPTVILINNVFVQRLSYDDPEEIIGVFNFTVLTGSVGGNNSATKIDDDIVQIETAQAAQFSLRFTASDGANTIVQVSNFTVRQEEWSEIQQLRMNLENTTNSNLGNGLSVNQDFIFAGAPGAQTVEVYKRDGSTWSSHETLTPTSSSSAYGFSLASHGDFLLVGAPDAVSNNGQIWLYEYNSANDSWEYAADTTVLSSSRSGFSVDLHNNFAVVGGPNNNTVVVYNLQNSTLDDSIVLNASNISGIASGDDFGFSTAIDVTPSGSIYVAIGSPGDESNRGSAYAVVLSYDNVFSIEDQTKITGQYDGAGDEFGFSVDIQEYELAVGVPNSDLNNLNSGLVYVYKENPLNGDWNETDSLLTSSANSNSLFGTSVRFNRNILYPGGNYVKSIVIGAQLDSATGSVYSFEYDAANDRYVQHRQILDINASSSDFFGKNISTQNNELVIASTGAESLTGTTNNTGKVYVYNLEKAENVAEFTNSPFTAYLKQGTTETYDIAVTHPDGLEVTLSIYSVANIDAERVSITDGVLSVDMPSDNVDNVTVTIGVEDQYGRIALQENTFIPTNTDNIEITSSDLFNPQTGTYTVTVNNSSAEVYTVSAVPTSNISENQIGVSGNTITINDLVQDEVTPLSFRAIVETGANGYIDYLDVSRTFRWTFDVDDLSYDSVSLNIAGLGNNQTGIYFRPNGTRMFIFVGSSAQRVNQYDLSTAWDLTTASLSDTTASVDVQTNLPAGFTMSRDGTKFYVTDNNTGYLYQYAMSTAWDLENVTYEGRFNHRNQDTQPYDMVFNDTGTKLFVLGRDNDSVYEYTVTTPWDITGTVTYNSVSLSVNGQDASPAGILLDDTGTKLYYTGISNDDIHQYNLSTAYDLSTAVYSGLSSALQGGNPYGFYVKQDDGTKLYIISNNGDTVYQYSTGL